MKHSSIPPSGAPAMLQALLNQSRVGNSHFRWAEGTARVDLPPSWCAVPPGARILTVVPSETPRAQMAGQGPSSGEATGQHNSWSTWSMPGHASGSQAPDGGCSTMEFLRAFSAANPGVQPQMGLIPHTLRMGRTPYIDLNGAQRIPMGRISETETVWNTCVILADAYARPIPREGDVPSWQYFDCVTLDQPAVPGDLAAIEAQKQIDRQCLANLCALLDQSPTYRRLVRQAVDRGHLHLSAAAARWTVAMVSPHAHRDGTALYHALGVDGKNRLLMLPMRDAMPVGNELYLFKGGFLMPMSPICYSVRALLIAITQAMPPSQASWRGPNGCVDPARIAEQGAGERGVVDYLAQRIMGEIGTPAYSWLSPLTFVDGDPVTPPAARPPLWRPAAAVRQGFDAIGGIAAVQEYVEWQDAFLQGQFPIG